MYGECSKDLLGPTVCSIGVIDVSNEMNGVNVLEEGQGNALKLSLVRTIPKLR